MLTRHELPPFVKKSQTACDMPSKTTFSLCRMTTRTKHHIRKFRPQYEPPPTCMRDILSPPSMFSANRKPQPADCQLEPPQHPLRSPREVCGSTADCCLPCDKCGIRDSDCQYMISHGPKDATRSTTFYRNGRTYTAKPCGVSWLIP